MSRKFALLTVMLISGLVSRVVAQTRNDPAEWAPADAIFYAGVGDIQTLFQEIDRTSSVKMAADPDVKAALGDKIPAALFQKLREKMARSLNVSEADLRKLLRGPVTFYGGIGADQKESSVLIAGVGDAAMAKKVYDQAVQRLTQKYGGHETTSEAGQTIDQFARAATPTDEKNDSPFGKGGLSGLQSGDVSRAADEAFNKLFSPEALGKNVALCLANDRLFVAPTAAEVKRALALDKARSFAGTAAYKKLAELKPAGSVRFYLNAKSFFEYEQKRTTNERARKGFEDSGLTALRDIYGNVRIGGEAFDLKLDMVMTLAGEATGGMKMFRTANGPIAPPPGAPEDTVAYVLLNLNPPQFVEDALTIADNAQPGAGAMVRAQLSGLSLGGAPVNVFTECLAHLDGPLAAHLSFSKPYGTPDSPRALLQLRHKNKAALGQFLAHFNVPPQDVGGAQVFTLPMADVNVGLTDDRVLLGSKEAIERAAKGGEGGLRNSSKFKNAAQAAPAEAGLFVFADLQQLLRVIIETKEAGKSSYSDAADKLLQALYDLPAAEPAKLRPALRYMDTLVLAIASNNDGARLSFAALKPEPAGK